MELINGEYVMSDKETAWRKSVMENSFGKIMSKYLDDQLAEVIKKEDEADEDLWNS